MSAACQPAAAVWLEAPRLTYPRCPTAEASKPARAAAPWGHRRQAPVAATASGAASTQREPQRQQAPTDVLYDAVIVGSGMGGLSTAAQLAAKGAKVVVLEK